MKMSSTSIVVRALALLSALAVSFSAVAQTKAAPTAYPNKPIKIVVPYPPGGTSDILARLIGQKMGEAWNTQVIIDNKPGANGNIGADLVVKSPADGYTLLLADIGSLAISPSVYSTLPFDPAKDFAPVGMVAYSPHILVTHASVKVNTVKELIDVAKSKPGKLNYATSGIGGAPQLAGVEFANRAGISWTYIPYKGGAQAVADIAAGQADVMFNGMLATYPQVKAGNLKLLAVSSATRVASIPDVPTVAESGFPGFETGSFQGVLAPAGTPADIVAKLNTEMVRILKLADVRERLAAQGAEARADTPEALGAFIRSEKARWGKVVKDAGIKLD
jgi:tripartite-type tricarboxylate transporter receptor subunit TctC